MKCCSSSTTSSAGSAPRRPLCTRPLIDRRKRPFAQWPHQPEPLLSSMTALADVMPDVVAKRSASRRIELSTLAGR